MNNRVCINQKNIHLLNETIALIGSVTTESYSYKSILFNADTLGVHVCHIIERYESFLDGLSKDAINYGLRKSNFQIFSNPQAAMVKINGIIDQINFITCEDLNFLIDIEMDTGSACEGVQTTIGRELQFLWSHHVHHNTIIHGTIESPDESYPQDFGIAQESCKVLE